MSLLTSANNDVRVLIIHPDNRFMRLYLSDLVRDYEVLYLRFPGQNLNVQEAEYRVFGQWNPIGEITTMPDVYILDECDRLSAEAFNELLPSLILCNPIAIVIFSRTIPFAIMDETNYEDHLHHLQMVSDNGLSTPDYADLPLMEVSGFGIGRVRLNGQDISFESGELTREFFFYLLENPVISRDGVIEQFWADYDHRSAVDNFHMMLNRLNALFGLRFVYPSGAHYQINRDIFIDYDVDNYRNILHDIAMAYDDPTPDPDAYKNAFRLYHHDFLQTIQSEWVRETREELRRLQTDVCVSLAKVATTPENALGLYAMAFRYNPYREDIAHAMMTHYLNNDLPCDALMVYRTIEENLAHQSDISPGKALKQVLQQAEEQCPQQANNS